MQALALCARRGLVDLSAVGVDGSPIAEVTAGQQQRLADYARRTLQDQAVGRRRTVRRPPASIETKTKVVAQQARLARAQAALHRARYPRPIPFAAARASLTDPHSSRSSDVFNTTA
ncbi:hypothetical protein ACFHW0_25160 [Micromonospora sp. LOL_025]|uniref:hypothetical protein n=1 Tax=Micromonospora sp. LOL_025 TaxID=3345413 RepID=UPI003A84C781